MSRLRFALATVVTLVWAFAWMAAIVRSDYAGIGAITPVALLAVGYLFSADALKMLRDGKGSDE